MAENCPYKFYSTYEAANGSNSTCKSNWKNKIWKRSWNFRVSWKDELMVRFEHWIQGILSRMLKGKIKNSWNFIFSNWFCLSQPLIYTNHIRKRSKKKVQRLAWFISVSLSHRLKEKRLIKVIDRAKRYISKEDSCLNMKRFLSIKWIINNEV